MDISKIDPALFTHALPIQIRSADIGRGEQVNNATILSYFEMGRIELLNEIIETANDWKRRGLVIAHSEADFVKPVFLQDRIIVHSRIAAVGTKSFKIDNVLTKETNGNKEIACVASFVLVCTDYSVKQTIEIPPGWKQKFLERIPK